MCEITKNNFKEKLPEIRKSLEKAKFIAVDLEFSALRPIPEQEPRLFDSNRERYAKFRKNLRNVLPLQIGITAFHFDHFSNDYFGEVFNFYIKPPAFANLDKSYWFQATSLAFLSFYNFDFNKFAYSGIPFLSNKEENDLRLQLKNNTFAAENCDLYYKFLDIAAHYIPSITKWYNTCKNEGFLEIPEITEKYKYFDEIRYFFHKHLRSRFKNLWTCEKNGCFVAKKVSDDELERLSKTCTLDEELVDTLMGFSHVFKLLTSMKKPLVGHNMLQDLIIMINTFEEELPASYSKFKQVAHHLFPVIFDTKTIYYELRRTIPKEKEPQDTSLEDLFIYFKDGLGRHLVLDRSAIESNIEEKNRNKYHEAGWDSFCAGYIFIRMAYYNISLNKNSYPKLTGLFPSIRTRLISSEVPRIMLPLFSTRTINFFKNTLASRVKVTFFSIFSLLGLKNIDGPDPVSSRPPWLVVESRSGERIDMNDLVSQLSCYGFVDVKKLSNRGNRVLVAAATLRAARDISNNFTTNPGLQVKQYDILRHSPVARATFILSAVTVSGTILLWLTHTLLKR